MGGVNAQLKTITDGWKKHSFYYDEVGNLAWAAFDKETVYRSMDIAGNLYKTKNHTDRSYGAGGQLTKSNRAAYQYDALGNLIKKTAEDGIWKYEYGCNGFLKKVIRPDKKEVTFQYDALGRRIKKSFDGITTRFLWDGDVILHEWKESGNEEATSPTTWLFEEGSFTPLSKITEEEAYSVISDQLGTPFEMYDTHGKKVWGNDLDVYGRIREREGDAGYCYFRFPGQYEDVETGLYYNRFRYYDPEMGAYTQRDPIGLAGGNPTIYGYVWNTLIQFDPFGLSNVATELIHFMQSSIKNQTGVHTVLGNADALRNGTLSVNELPKIRAWKDSAGKIWTLDHRRLAAFKEAGMRKVPVEWASKSTVKNEMWKMTTKNGGTSIKLKMGDGTSKTIDNSKLKVGCR